MEHECVARVKNVKALDVAFLDQRIPRYERDIINMVGMGVTENAASDRLHDRLPLRLRRPRAPNLKTAKALGLEWSGDPGRVVSLEDRAVERSRQNAAAKAAQPL